MIETLLRSMHSLVIVIVYLMVLLSQCIIFISWFQFLWVSEDGPSFHICDVSHQPRCPSRASSFTSWTTFCECLWELVRLHEICSTFLFVTEESRAFYYCNIVLLRSSCMFMHVPNFLNNTQKRKLSLSLVRNGEATLLMSNLMSFCDLITLSIG